MRLLQTIRACFQARKQRQVAAERQTALAAYNDACARRDSRDKHRTWEALHAKTLRELAGGRR